MQLRPLNWNAAVQLLAASLLLAVFTGKCVAGGLAKTAPPKPLPADIVAAWEKAGAKTGWMALNKIQFYFRIGEKGQEGELPAFLFQEWQPDVIGRLPQPERQFGIILRGKVTDMSLKELAAMKSLHTLYVHDSLISDVGLKELSGLKSLQTLNLGDTKVTDAGLKELSKLKSLRTLNLSNTKVTDTGVAELQKALPECNIHR